MKTSLPEFLRPYFWDVEFGELDSKNNDKFIVARLLDRGNWQANKWVEKTYTAELVRDVLMTQRDFSLRSASFWGNIYGVIESQIRCFQEPYRTLRKTLWPY